MSKEQQIAAFLGKYVTGLPRWHGPFRAYLSQGYVWDTSRESAEEIAKQFLAMAEFRTLQLGTWLGTTDGQIFVEAVEMVLPMFYVEDVELLVEALQLAAALQQKEGRRKALVGAVIACAVIRLAA